ncbi:MAG: hypothetical protein PWP15_619 [Methanothermococcus sp.]|nr:hypothetical protein [Methanothermococcus sp.]MDK2988421.1 hypothetical protein [Methanothermococcus sp.]
MKMTLLKCPGESPEKVLKLFDEIYSKTRIFYLLKTALDLNLFDYLNDFKSAEELADMLNTNLTLTKYMLRIFTELGILESRVEMNSNSSNITNNIIYRNTNITNTYLKKDSEFSIINPISYYFENIKNWENLIDILKNKDNFSNTDTNNFFPEVVKRMADECKCWELQKVLYYISKYEEFKNAKKLLDLAGGHGLYAIGFSMLNKNLKCRVFDLPNVVEETKKFIEKYNAKNISTIAGDFYKDDIGNDYDIIFTSYNPGGKNPNIAKKVYNALNNGGLFINKQFFPEKEEHIEDYLNNMEWNFSKPAGLEKSRLRFTFKGDLNFDDYLKYLENLGFKILEVVDIPELLGFKNNSPAKMIVAKKL